MRVPVRIMQFWRSPCLRPNYSSRRMNSGLPILALGECQNKCFLMDRESVIWWSREVLLCTRSSQVISDLPLSRSLYRGNLSPVPPDHCFLVGMWTCARSSKCAQLYEWEKRIESNLINVWSSKTKRSGTNIRNLFGPSTLVLFDTLQSLSSYSVSTLR